MKLDPAVQKGVQGNFPKVETGDKGSPAGAPAAFSWANFGFREGQKGSVTPGPPGMSKLSFDSANSAAGFSALLPAVQKGAK